MVFSLVGDPKELSEMWIRWKRAFGLYLRAKCVELDGQKVALLLHSGKGVGGWGHGAPIFGVHSVGRSGDSDLRTVYRAPRRTLRPKEESAYERHLYRKMAQNAAKGEVL